MSYEIPETKKAVSAFGKRLKWLMKKKNNKKIRITNKDMTNINDNYYIGISNTMLGYYFNNPTLKGRKEPVQSAWEITCKIIDFLRSRLGDDLPYDWLFGIEYSKKLKNKIKQLDTEIQGLKSKNGILESNYKRLYEESHKANSNYLLQLQHDALVNQVASLKRERIESMERINELIDRLNDKKT